MKKSEIDKSDVRYKEGTRLMIVMIVIGILFLALTGYLTYIELFAKDSFMNNAFNQRQWKQEQNTLRGQIVDRSGVILAESEREGDEQTRIYPFGSLYAHVVGYNSKIYGKSQIELAYNKNLAGLSEFSNFTDISGTFQGEEKVGDTVELTISHELQKKAQEMLGNRNGAVVAMDPSTGEILCMVSNPTFDPNSASLQKNWETLSNQDNSPFLSRATSGLYAPGSIFKTIMAAAAVEEGLDDMTFEDKGSIVIDGKTFQNSGGRAHGTIDLERAYAVSSNVAFMELGEALGEDTIREYIQKFKIGETIPFDLPLTKSRFDQPEPMSETEIASTSIGQGKLLVTPLQMALMVSTIANDGVMQKPYIVSRVVNSTGIPVQTGKPQVLDRIISPKAAAVVTDYMIETVENGTATQAKISGMKVAGKTGTAENEMTAKEKEHTWFVGFAPADNPKIAVAIILEYSGGSGGSNAAPIARELFRIWANR